MKIKMSSTRKATADGYPNEYEEGEIYETGKTVHENVAKAFLENGWCVVVKDKKEK